MRFYIQVVIVLACVLWCNENARAQVFVSTQGYVEFISTAPLLEFKGTSNNLSGLINFETGEVDFFVDLASLNTGNRRRDRDMRQVYLETEKYPFAEFSGFLDSTVNFETAGKQDVTVTGQFKMREISRQMNIEGTVEHIDGAIRVQATWQILLEDFNIDRPRVVFYELSNVQTINIDITLQPHDED